MKNYFLSSLIYLTTLVHSLIPVKALILFKRIEDNEKMISEILSQVQTYSIK